MSTDDYQIMDWSHHGIPADVEVRAWPMGMITFHRGAHQSTIDTTDMTREEVVRAIAVALAQLHKQESYSTASRAQRRRMDAESRRAFN